MVKDDIGRNVHILSRQIKRRLDEAVLKYNVTAVQCSFIEYISHQKKAGNVYARDLEKKFNMRRATVAEILRLMEKNDLVIRKSISGDARLKQIQLTDKSMEIKNAIKKETKKIENILKEGLSEEEVGNFMKTLKKMSENIEQKK